MKLMSLDCSPPPALHHCTHLIKTERNTKAMEQQSSVLFYTLFLIVCYFSNCQKGILKTNFKTHIQKRKNTAVSYLARSSGLHAVLFPKPCHSGYSRVKERKRAKPHKFFILSKESVMNFFHFFALF